MKYEAEINGQVIALEVEERDGQVLATIGERLYRLEVARPEEGVYLLFLDNSVFEARVAAGKDAYPVTLRAHTFAVKVVDRKHRRATTEPGDSGRQQLRAPMPGKVVRLLCQAGDEVITGQGVVVVEAMKMQNEIKSPKTGKVVEVRVREGDTVAANQVLAVIE